VPIRHGEEFVVGGYLPSPRGFSTLILGQHNREGNLTLRDGLRHAALKGVRPDKRRRLIRRSALREQLN